MKSVKTCICSLLLAAVATGAHAAEVNSVVVGYADLDLSTPAGTQRLHLRLRRAAQQVCGWGHELRDLIRSRDYDRCATEAFNNAMRDVNERHLPSACLATPVKNRS
jgi:UrcA family protein